MKFNRKINMYPTRTPTLESTGLTFFIDLLRILHVFGTRILATACQLLTTYKATANIIVVP